MLTPACIESYFRSKNNPRCLAPCDCQHRRNCHTKVLKICINLKFNLSSDVNANPNCLFPSSQDGTITTSFQQSPVMSPYLLAFAVSDFALSTHQDGPTLHRIFARPDTDAVERSQFALRNTDLFLKELERYVRYEYELTKLDQIALPDFQSGELIFHR